MDANVARKIKTSHRHCCVPLCFNDDRRDKDCRLSFHTLPTDTKLRKQWIWKIRRDEGPHFQVTKSTFVCSDHFTQEDFKKSFTGLKRNLKCGAIPSVFSFPTEVTRMTAFSKKWLRQSEVETQSHGSDSSSTTYNDAGAEQESVFTPCPSSEHDYHIPSLSGPMCGRMEQQEPKIKTEVKIEIDVAEEPPYSWSMTEEQPHGQSMTEEQPHGAGCSTTEQPDPMIKTEVKVEFDDAEEPPYSWYMTEEHQHEPNQSVGRKRVPTISYLWMDRNKEQITKMNSLNEGKEIESEKESKKEREVTGRDTRRPGKIPSLGMTGKDISSLQMSERQDVNTETMGQKPETQPDPCGGKGVCLNQEASTDDSASVYTGQTSETQRVSGSHSGVRLKHEFRSESTASIHFGQSTETSDDAVSIHKGEYSETAGKVWNLNSMPGCVGKSNDPCIVAVGVNPAHNNLKQEMKATSTHEFKGIGPEPLNFPEIFRHQDQDVSVNSTTSVVKKTEYNNSQMCTSEQTRPGHLKQYIFINTGDRPHICQECGAKFTQSSTLKQHMLRHTGQRPHICQECGAKFYESGHLMKHMLIHTGKRPHICQECGAKFAQSGTLKRHMLRHTGQKPHICQECGAKFTRYGTLKRHILVHTGEKPHICQVCGAKFSQSGNLRKHMFRHTGKKPHSCQECDEK